MWVEVEAAGESCWMTAKAATKVNQLPAWRCGGAGTGEWGNGDLLGAEDVGAQSQNGTPCAGADGMGFRIMSQSPEALGKVEKGGATGRLHGHAHDRYAGICAHTDGAELTQPTRQVDDP